MKQRELECLDKAIYPTPARKRNLKRIACYALLAATVFTVPGTANAELDSQGKFFKLNNPGDRAFNQLLGINDHEIIAAISATAPLSSTMGTFSCRTRTIR